MRCIHTAFLGTFAALGLQLALTGFRALLPWLMLAAYAVLYVALLRFISQLQIK